MKPVLKIKGKVQNIEKKEKNKPLMKTIFLFVFETVPKEFYIIVFLDSFFQIVLMA
jgi:hypothetical protein